MPTGYTATLAEKEQDFKDFVLQCSRNFGALISMKDEPFDAPIPDEFYPSDYHERELYKATAELKDFESSNVERKQEEYQNFVVTETKRKREYNNKCGAQKERYEKMLAKVDVWEPPTSDHSKLKSFMQQQLKSSIDFDCNFEMKPVIISFKEWEAQRLKQLKWDVDYHTKELAAEIERCKSRTAWVQTLKKSLAIDIK
jgi:hypothetical protein